MTHISHLHKKKLEIVAEIPAYNEREGILLIWCMKTNSKLKQIQHA